MTLRPTLPPGIIRRSSSYTETPTRPSVADLLTDPRIGLPGDVQEAAVARGHLGEQGGAPLVSELEEIAEGVDRTRRIEHLAVG